MLRHTCASEGEVAGDAPRSNVGSKARCQLPDLCLASEVHRTPACGQTQGLSGGQAFGVTTRTLRVTKGSIA